MTRPALALSILLALAATVAPAAEPKATLAGDNPDLAVSTRTTPVLVTNFPADPDGNLRVVEQSAQPRQVEVVNLPATQQVSGQVNVANLPLDASGNLRIADQGSQRRFGFVGVTSQRFDGAGGFATMTRACYNQYPGSRVAFTDEYLFTINPPDIPETA